MRNRLSKVKEILGKRRQDAIEEQEAEERLAARQQRIEGVVRDSKAVAEREGRPYLFTVIIPAYNAQDYIVEAVESVVKQTIGFENIQIIIVDDGSTDSTPEVCKILVESYPNNIIYDRQENKGVSAARNRGLDLSQGLFIGFLDADDRISRNWHIAILKYAAKHPDIKVFAGKTRFFEASKGAHPLNYFYGDQNRIINLNKKYDYYPLSATRSYFHYSALERKRFKESLKYTEDSLLVHEVLLDDPRYAALASPVYYYRKRADENSASNKGRSTENWYCDVLRDSHMAIMDVAEAQYGYVPKYLQYAVMYDLAWRLKAKPDSSIGKALVDEYKADTIRLLKRIDDEVIVSLHGFDLLVICYALALKYSVELDEVMSRLVSVETGLIIRLSDLTETASDVCTKFYADWGRIALDIVELSKDKSALVLTGRLPKIRLSEEQVCLRFNIGEDFETASLFRHPHSYYAAAFDDLMLNSQLCFKVELPLRDSMQISAQVTVGEGLAQKSAITFGKFSHLSNVMLWTSYSILDDSVLLQRNGTSNSFTVQVGKISAKKRNELEEAVETALADTDGGKWAKLRRRAVRYKKRNPEERLWLFTDRVTSAEDSGEVMFRYVIEHPVENVRPVFVIRDDVPDFERLQQYGEVVAAGSDDHLLMVLCAEKIISSAGDEWVINPFESGYKYVQDMLRFKFVFLQHGVIKDSLADWLYVMKKNIDLFVTSAERERQSILEGDYGYDESKVILTGLPRWDSFESYKGQSERVIYLMPTWRNYLSDGTQWNASSTEDVASLTSSFAESSYYQFFESILTDQRLNELLRRYDYRLKFAPHPRIGPGIDLFTASDRVEVLVPESFTYADAYKDLSLLVTDYSSVAFNVAIMKKPVLYAQFDKEEFYEKHTGKKDYYTYEEDGFGPVVTSKDALVDEIEHFLANGMTMDPMYEKRVDDFFYWPESEKPRAQLVLDCILAEDK